MQIFFTLPLLLSDSGSNIYRAVDSTRPANSNSDGRNTATPHIVAFITGRTVMACIQLYVGGSCKNTPG